jgi:hypothetical protein
VLLPSCKQHLLQHGVMSYQVVTGCAQGLSKCAHLCLEELLESDVDHAS